MRRKKEQEKERAGERRSRKRKKEESLKKIIDYFPPSPVYDPSFKEDALPLFDHLKPNPEKEEKQREE